MFDRYIVHRGPEHVTVSNHEHRAPTDESVRLLREMESAARSSVVEAMRIKSNDVEATVHRHENPMDWKTLFVVFYAINGKRREVRVAVEEPTTIEKCLDLLWKALAEDIAAYILQGSIKTLVGKGGWK